MTELFDKNIEQQLEIVDHIFKARKILNAMDVSDMDKVIMMCAGLETLLVGNNLMRKSGSSLIASLVTEYINMED